MYYIPNMNQLITGEFKSKFSQALRRLAALVLYRKIKSKKIKLGLLEGKIFFKIHKGFKMTDEEFLKS